MGSGNPAWLDACHVQKILRKSEKDESIEISDITISPATAKGDNYSSVMYRVVAAVSRVQDGHKIEEKKGFIVKSVLPGEMFEQMMDAIGFFVTELTMMSVTLPRMNEILQTLSPTSLGPRCFYVQYEKPTHVIMEDLLTKGFRMADRQAGLDLDHCLVAFRNLGRFHAASIALREQDPKALAEYKHGVLHKDQHPMLSQMIQMGAKSLSNEMAKWSELSPRIKEKILKLSEVLFEKGCQAAVYREDDFNVLCHGDFWVNNMMFRYDEQQKPTDYVFVDFQISHCSSPAYDILYFFGTSPADEVRLHHREQLLQEYHASLSSTMAKLKCNTEVLSFASLQESVKKRAFGEVFASLTVLPLAAFDKPEEMNFEKISLDKGEFDNPSFRSKTYRKIITTLLPRFDSLGLLDV